MKQLISVATGLFFIFTGCCTSSVYGRNMTNNYTYIITLYPEDCVNCLNALSELKTLDQTIPLIFVFEEMYQGDSATLAQDYYLNDYHAPIVFSDSLFRVFKNKGAMQSSSVSLLNNNNGQHVTMPLTALVTKQESLRHYIQISDTIPLDKNDNNGRSQLLVSEDHLYMVNSLRGAVNVYSRLSKQKIYEIRLDDSAVRAGYMAKFGAKDGVQAYNSSESYIERNKMIGRKSKMESYQVQQDTFMMMISQPELVYNKYPNPNEGDSIIVDFYTLLSYHSGKLIDVAHVENYMTGNYADSPGIRRLNKDRFDAYFPQPLFFTSGGSLYVELIGNYIMLDGDNWALARYKRDNKNHWVFDQFAAQLPAYYSDTNTFQGYNYMFYAEYITHSNGYFSFILGDTLYSVNGTPDIPVNFIPQKINKKVSVEDFIAEPDYMYLGIWDTKMAERYLIYYKYNKATQKVESEKNSQTDDVFFKKGALYFRIDPYDPNYAFGFLDHNTLIRYKIF